MKTIVNIVSDENPIPAYLFIKEMYEPGDKLMFISAKNTEDDLVFLSEMMRVPNDCIKEILLRNEMDEFKYEQICRTIVKRLQKGETYYVNLAGGSRYMALAVQQVFEKFGAEFFYVQPEKNIIIKSKFDDNINDNDDLHIPIKYRINLSEYIKLHEMQSDLNNNGHSPIRSEFEAQNLFDLFSQKLLSNRDYRILDILRTDYRNLNYAKLAEIEHPRRLRADAIPDIRKFLDFLSFVPESRDELNKSELNYLTGGWWEEFVYYKIKETVKPDDIAIGPVIRTKGVKRQNELDVVFIKDNQLYVIECKTGVHTESLFNEIVYKACALKEALLGITCKYYICSMKKDEDGSLKRIAKNMDITFWDFAVVSQPDLFEKKMKEAVR